jgi:hypothetical protein
VTDNPRKVAVAGANGRKREIEVIAGRGAMIASNENNQRIEVGAGTVPNVAIEQTVKSDPTAEIGRSRVIKRNAKSERAPKRGRSAVIAPNMERGRSAVMAPNVARGRSAAIDRSAGSGRIVASARSAAAKGRAAGMRIAPSVAAEDAAVAVATGLTGASGNLRENGNQIANQRWIGSASSKRVSVSTKLGIMNREVPRNVKVPPPSRARNLSANSRQSRRP